MTDNLLNIKYLPIEFYQLLNITVFIVVLLAGLIWLWIKGALDWGPSSERRPHA